MRYVCAVCSKEVEPDLRGEVRLEGITEAPKGKAWVWGPVPVHEDCRLELATPYDDSDEYVHTWQMMRA
jgi:hypothetical protein